MHPTDVYITPSEVSRMLGLTQHQVRQLAWEKVLETVRVAGRTHFFRAEVEAYKAKQLPPPKAPVDAIQQEAHRHATYGVA
jgi:excisionase family DNA binding protein